ncbi:class I adenylate-forming enzyme family protein [Sphingomonas sp.]|jgi:long-chain acyl-CoA synthetase|uniref:class I adenylate-forming enzyme family protein n=1 Tax=Sphingomonas sp. TaxID=28214 RepID=UPI0035C7C55D
MFNRSAHLFARERDCPAKVALHFEDQAITFAALAAQVRAMSAELARQGVERGCRVGIMLPTSPDFIVVQQALFLIGAIVSPLNIFYRPTEVAHVVASCDLTHLIVHADLIDRAPTDCIGLRSLRNVLMIGGDGGAVTSGIAPLQPGIAAGEGPKPAEVAADDIVMLLNTSATTGKSKGVMLTAANLAANYDRTPAWLGLTAADVILCALPLYNTFGLNQGINAMLVTGATMVLLPRFDARKCVEAICRFHCTFVPAVPTMLQKIVDEVRPGSADLESVKHVMTGGAPVPAPLLRRVLATMGPDTVVLTGYGLTEGTALVTLTAVRLDASGDLEHGRTIGRVLDGMELAIRSEGGEILPPNSVGEIVVRGPNVMAGYHKAPYDTAAAMADGWLLSGDLGYIDTEGYAFIVDRKKDVIIRGGQNIYPADIEEVLYQCAGVAEAAVVGIADDMLGEVPVAYVALQPAADVSASRLIEHCRAELAHYKVPAEIVIRPELPKGPTGKILRRALRPQQAAVA